MDQKTWDLRLELYRAFHRWPWLLACFAGGALLGWLAAFVWPAYIRSEQTVYVGLNPYRTYSDTKFLALARPKYSNIDNYHYWQMSQLETFIFSTPVLDDTLADLRQTDAYWDDVSADGLRNRLTAEWRTAGDWTLAAVDDRAAQSRQAVEAWSAVVARRVQAAVAAAQQTFQVDQELQANAAFIGPLERRLVALQTARSTLGDWRTRLAGLPPDQPLDASLRWQLNGLIASLAGDDPAWHTLLVEQPQAQTSAAQALEWLEKVFALVESDQAALPLQCEALLIQRTVLQDRYRQYQESSWSLSPNLALESIGPVSTQTVRPASLLALIGGLVGLLGWALLELARLTRQERAHV